MKKYVLPVIFCCATYALMAHTIKDSAYIRQSAISFSAGISYPGGDFGNQRDSIFFRNDSDIMRAGYANTGYYFQLTGQTFFTKIFGLKLLFGESTYSFNTNAFREANNTYNVSPKGLFHVTELLVGPCMQLYAGRFGIELSALGGPISSSFPELIERGAFTIDIKTATSPGYHLSASCTYNVNSHLAIGFNAGYSRVYMYYPKYDYYNTGIQYICYPSVLLLKLKMRLLHAGILITYSK